MKLIEVKNISFWYGKDLILKDINFEVEKGDFFAITGPNGGGKSTLIKIILGLLKPQKGEVIYYDLTKEDIGYVPQNTNINLSFPIKVIDVVMMGNGSKHRYNRLLSVKYSTFEIECARNSLAEVGMESYLDYKISNLSGGQRQRVMIARAICSHPKLLILDEPTSNIDIKGQEEIYNLLKRLNESITILVVTHDLKVISNYANKVLYINREGFMHTLKDSRFKIDSATHICEVELMQMLGKKDD